MESFQALVDVADRLLGPGGCPWDHSQTFVSLKPYLFEEAHEVAEAVDLDDMNQLTEELGDLCYLVLFYAKLAEKQQLFTLNDIFNGVRQKMIRRHPHVFSGLAVQDADEVKRNWDAIKKQEKQQRTQITDGIPPSLSTLARTQKILQRLKRPTGAPSLSSQEIGEALLHLVQVAEASGVDADSALRTATSAHLQQHLATSTPQHLR
jgi:MazG family protein